MPYILRGRLCHAVACICSSNRYNTYKIKIPNRKVTLYEIKFNTVFTVLVEGLRIWIKWELCYCLVQHWSLKIRVALHVGKAHHLVHHQVLPAPVVQGLFGTTQRQWHYCAICLRSFTSCATVPVMPWVNQIDIHYLMRKRYAFNTCSPYKHR